MTLFDDRERAFENRFARDQELRFLVLARRNRLTGQWAAARLGLNGEEADSYARSVIAADLEEAGDADVIRKLMADLGEHGVSESEVREALAANEAEARRQIMAEL